MKRCVLLAAAAVLAPALALALPPPAVAWKRDQSERRASWARMSSGKAPPGFASRRSRCSGSLHRMRRKRSSMTGDGPTGGSIISFEARGKSRSCPARSTTWISAR
jgi:hypothetical protein